LATETNSRTLIILKGEIASPPFSTEAKLEADTLLRRLLRGESIGLPSSRPMSCIGRRCHELRIQDENKTWRILYRLEHDAVVVLHIFDKKTQQTPKHVIDTCKTRLASYLQAIK